MPNFPFQKKEKEDPTLKPEVLTSTEKMAEEEEISSYSKAEKEKDREKEKTYEEKGEQPSAAAPAKVFLPQDEVQTTITKTEKSAILLEIEQILSENLDQLYTSLTPEQKIIFKKTGEETAGQIEILLKEFQLNFNKILLIIKEWLLLLAKMIPGVNKIFLIQEAKIKTDKILLLREKEIKKK